MTTKLQSENSGNLLKRTLTMKAKIGFGWYSNFSVEEMFIAGKECALIAIYFLCEKIDFTNDVLERLGIDEKIIKPGTNKDRKQHFISQFIKKSREGKTEKEIMNAANAYYARRNKTYKALAERDTYGLQNSRGALKYQNQKNRK
jgi:hypothetical protein